METLWTLIGVGAAGLTSTSFIPQLILRLRRPGQARMSYGTLLTFGLGAVLWTSYGVHLQDAIIIGANIFVLVNILALGIVQSVQERSSRLMKKS